jgi:hypothetical protein
VVSKGHLEYVCGKGRGQQSVGNLGLKVKAAPFSRMQRASGGRRGDETSSFRASDFLEALASWTLQDSQSSILFPSAPAPGWDTHT